MLSTLKRNQDHFDQGPNDTRISPAAGNDICSCRHCTIYLLRRAQEQKTSEETIRGLNQKANKLHRQVRSQQVDSSLASIDADFPLVREIGRQFQELRDNDRDQVRCTCTVYFLAVFRHFTHNMSQPLRSVPAPSAEVDLFAQRSYLNTAVLARHTKHTNILSLYQWY